MQLQMPQLNRAGAKAEMASRHSSEWASRVDRLCGCFPTAPPEAVLDALVAENGHAGRAARTIARSLDRKGMRAQNGPALGGGDCLEDIFAPGAAGLAPKPLLGGGSSGPGAGRRAAAGIELGKLHNSRPWRWWHKEPGQAVQAALFQELSDLTAGAVAPGSYYDPYELGLTTRIGEAACTKALARYPQLPKAAAYLEQWQGSLRWEVVRETALITMQRNFRQGRSGAAGMFNAARKVLRLLEHRASVYYGDNGHPLAAIHATIHHAAIHTTCISPCNSAAGWSNEDLSLLWLR